MEKSIVLLSGGLDSLVNFTQAMKITEVSLILTFDYGQHAASREIEATSAIAAKYSIPHKIINLDWLSTIDTGLTKGNIPSYDPSRLDDTEYASQTAKTVWVPNRNGVMINIAAAYAEHLKATQIIVGFNKEEAATFPDNTSEYLDRVNQSLEYSTLYHPKVVCYTINMTKSEIVRLGDENNSAFEYLWSCYASGEAMCGTCESCRRLIRALKNEGLFEEFIRRNRWGFKQ